MKCPSCNKFAALEMQEPENNSLELDVSENDEHKIDSATITAEVRILRNSECCGDEMKEYTFNAEADVPDEILAKMAAVLKADPEAEFEVEENSLEATDEGGGRYRKSYFGFELVAAIKHGSDELGTVVITDKVAASEMEELN